MKNIKNFYRKIFIFLVVKFSMYLNRHVFVISVFEEYEAFNAILNTNDEVSCH